jgi:hypothetical protein
MIYPFLFGYSLPDQGAPDCLSSCQIGMRGARGAEGSRSTRTAFLEKQNELFGYQVLVTEGVYRLPHQYIVRVGRATGDSLSPVSDGQL